MGHRSKKPRQTRMIMFTIFFKKKKKKKNRYAVPRYAVTRYAVTRFTNNQRNIPLQPLSQSKYWEVVRQKDKQVL